MLVVFAPAAAAAAAAAAAVDLLGATVEVGGLVVEVEPDGVEPDFFERAADIIRSGLKAPKEKVIRREGGFEIGRPRVEILEEIGKAKQADGRFARTLRA